MGCWTHHNMWLLFIVGLQVGLLTAAAPDSICDPSTDFSCRNDSSICIALSRVKDGSPDCPDKSDEECNEEEFQCQSIHQCIPKERFHDGWPDCDDGSDEECSRGQFRCRCGVPHCIEGSKVKDGVKDCDDGSDEVSEKNRNKSARCPDESRLQDLLAVEKKRRKRQIHAFGSSLDGEDTRTYDESIMNLQPTVANSQSNNFQYSYTKFLNERLSRDRYNPQREDIIDKEKNGNIETSALNNKETILSTTPFMVRTETDLYGSLNSGKIYQTAVNEPVSAIRTADATTLKYSPRILKHDNKNEYPLKRPFDLKVVEYKRPIVYDDEALPFFEQYFNLSDIYMSSKPDKKDRRFTNKTDKANKRRKLLSVSDEHQDLPNKQILKRSLQDSESDISHIPLEHSPTVPYMPQSNIHTTGVVMSTTGTDIIGGRTTEWTTIIEGTFISGTYAHIVHSTSRIYYTVETPIITTENTTPTNNIFSTSNEENPRIEPSTTETRMKESFKKTQRINDKSLRALDAFINVLSSSKVSNDFQITPTPVLLDNTDVTLMNEDKNVESSTNSNTLESSMATKSLLFDEKDFILPVTVSENSESISSEVIEYSTIQNDGENLSSTTVLPPNNISEIVLADFDKDIDLTKDGITDYVNEQDVSNAVGRMVGNKSFENVIRLSVENNTSLESSIESNTTIKSSSEGNMSQASSVEINSSKEVIHSSTVLFESNVNSRSILSPTEDILSDDVNIKAVSLESSIYDPSTSYEILEVSPSETPLSESPKEAKMETSLKIPDVSDLFAAFLPVKIFTTENIKPEVSLISEINLNSEKIESSVETMISSDVHTELENTDNLAHSEIVNSTIITGIVEQNSSIDSTTDFKTGTTAVGSSIIDETDSLPVTDSNVMVFLGIASTVNAESISPSSVSAVTDFSIPLLNEKNYDSENSKLPEAVWVPTVNKEKDVVLDDSASNDKEKTKSEASDITVLLLPSMNLDDLKNLMISSFEVSNPSDVMTVSDELTTLQSTTTTPSLDETLLEDKIKTGFSEGIIEDTTMSTGDTLSSSMELGGRAKRAVSESVTILRPEGRIVSTDARVFLTPTTHYTTYTYFTTVLVPGGGSRIISSLHVDSVILEPTDRAVYGYDDGHGCNECGIRNTAVRDQYETHYAGRPIEPDHYHVETVPHNAGRDSEITHRTTYTYYTTRFRGGTPFIETRKETKTDVTQLSTGRYSPFEIGTYYEGDYPDEYHYHTEAPRVEVSRPHDVTHRTTYTYYTTRIRDGITNVETRKETVTSATPIPTYYRPGHIENEGVRVTVPSYSQRIDPNLYKPDRVTHRTTYTYHTTRFRDGVPIVNTRRETETHVTPIPTYTRPGYQQRHTVQRVVPSRPVTYNAVTQTYNPYVRHGTDPYHTHRTTYTYFTTRLIGGSTHVDTRYVTETNVTPNPTVPHVRGTAYNRPNYDNGYYENDCPVCEAQRNSAVRHEPNTRVRGRDTIRANRRTEQLAPEITPSTATLFSTYTYATTQLTRGGRPVVRTREHTVTEVLSDVVLPTLKFGDRIRSKRTVRPEELPLQTDTVHVVPIRHTFSRTISYADGRQGRRIPINDSNRNRPNRLDTHHARTPNINKIDARNKHNEHTNRNLPRSTFKNEEFEIQPTSVTYYSTYTYFTTELQDGTPVTKSREHTVTEILTDVIVPTVSAVRRPYASHATRGYGESLHYRPARDLHPVNFENILRLRRLLSIEEKENVTKFSSSLSTYSSATYIQETTNTKTVITSELSPLKSADGFDLKSSINLTPPLEATLYEFIDNTKMYDVPSEIKAEFKVIESEEDLSPAGAEVRRAIVPSPVTHYTTYTYYTTKLKPGGDRIVETSTKVSSSVTYPQSAQAYDLEYTRVPYNKRKLYASRANQHQSGNTQKYILSSPVSHAARTHYQTDAIYGLDSQVHRSSSNPYRRQDIHDFQRVCPNCNSPRRHQKPYHLSGSFDRPTRVHKDNYLTRIPVRNTVNVARRIPDRASNEVYYPDSNIKPTRVTFYSTYTYFTTEPIDGSSVVRSREHTVTEILTDVIVPTVASLNRPQATVHEKFPYRTKRDIPVYNADVFEAEQDTREPLNFKLRRLLSVENENLTGEKSSDNFTTVQDVDNANNTNVSHKDKSENETLLYIDEKKNFTLLTENDFDERSNASETNISFQGSEIFSNDTSRFSETSDKQILKESELLVERNSSEISEISRINIIKDLGNETNTAFNSSLVSAPLSEKSADNVSNVNIEENKHSSDVSIGSSSNVSEDNARILPTSSFTFLNNNDDLTRVNSEGHTFIDDEKIKPNSDGTNVFLDALKSSFTYSTIFLETTEPIPSPSLTEIPFYISVPSNVEKILRTDPGTIFPTPDISSDTYETDLLSTEDLDAEGAEVRHAIVATPTTHYTTFTYFSTILKPGGKREVVTNTKVTSSIYYPDSTNFQRQTYDYHRNQRRPTANRVHKATQRRNYPQTTKIYEIYPERAVVRPQYAYPPSNTLKPYRPTFTRAAAYETTAIHNSNRCISCYKEPNMKDKESDYYKSDRNIYNRNYGKSYLTSVPVRRMTTQYRRVSNTVPYEAHVIKPSYTARSILDRRVATTHHRRVNNPNTIPYEVPEIKPTHVTYYSTYTYFTTELQSGSPVVRSREHTVTEILTNVIVPTVTSVASHTKYRSFRGKRYTPSEQNFDINLNSPFQRKLLSVDESIESADKDSILEDIEDNLNIIPSSYILNPVINEDISIENNLVVSLKPQDITPALEEPSSTPIEVKDDFLSNAQFSKAFAAYLAFVESSGANPENVTLDKNETLSVEKKSEELKQTKPSKSLNQSVTNFTSDLTKSQSKSMISILTSDVKRNGRMTKYTTTIYGTYINGVYAQRAKSTSDVIPITEMDSSPPLTTLMFSPSRLPGLVRSIVSRKIRGPVAVHLTTEIHGTFVGGAYAQTARVFTSSQPLSATRESTRHRIPSYSTSSPAGTRKTGLLSTRVLRSKVDGSTTLLFVSEIYGTHIGGAYAHLGTYTTRTLIQTQTSSAVELELTSTSLPTFYMEDLTTGLVKESVSEKSSNGITTRYHYQVFGTYLDGTYAHVPSISTETLTSESEETVNPVSSYTSHTELFSPIETQKITKSTINSSSKTLDVMSSKIGLIHASTRAHVTNGTTTQHIFEVHGTFLNGNYAHVPSVSVITIEPSTTLKSTENTEIISDTADTKSSDSESPAVPDFEVLTIFSDVKPESENTVSTLFPSESTIFFPLETESVEIIIGELNEEEKLLFYKNDGNEAFQFPSSSLVSELNEKNPKNEFSDPSNQSPNFFPVLLPEALRLSFSSDNSNQRVKRNDPFSPYLRSSFTDSIKSTREIQHTSLIVTTPLPASLFSELSLEFVDNATKLLSTSKLIKKAPFQTKIKNNFERSCREKSCASKSYMNHKTNAFFHKRSKRSPAAIRSSYGNNRRFGSSSSSPSNSRKFGSSNTFKREGSSSSTRGYRAPSSRSSAVPSKAISRAQQTTKSVPNFLGRPQRSKLNLASKTSSPAIKPTSTSSSTYSLPSIRSRRFGKKEPEKDSKNEEDFEASEAIPQSVTEEKVKTSATSSSRFRRPSKPLKFNSRSSSSSVQSRSNKIITPSTSRRSRIQIKNANTLTRNRKSSIRDYDYDIRPTATEPSESTSTKRRFTLTTTFEINLKSTAGYLTALDTDEGNNLQEDNSRNKRRNKSRTSNSRQNSSYKPVFDSDDNEVRPDKPKSLPLPVFGRSRGLKRPPKFDPRTIKATTTEPSSTIIYLTPSSSNDTEDIFSETSLNGPITVTDVFTTTKTLPVHLGLRTSFATITTTAYTTSTILPKDLTYLTLGGITKTLVSAITGLPDANQPADKQYTVVTEIILTTTEIESTSLVAIKVGFGTRTDTVVTKQKMTTLATQTNTIMEEKTAAVPFQQQYPYFPNPFAPPIPPQNTGFSLSLSENSFVSTQTITSTTVLPLFFNGKTVLTTLTSTSVSEETLVKTTTFKVPQQQTMHPFIFPQPVFILPSITTKLTLQFTAHNGEVYSIVTEITVPLALNGHTRIARSIDESTIHLTTSQFTVSPESSLSTANETVYSRVGTVGVEEEPFGGTILQSSFSTREKKSLSNQFTEYLAVNTDNIGENNKPFTRAPLKTKKFKNHLNEFKTSKMYEINSKSSEPNIMEFNFYKNRKLLQFDGAEGISDDKDFIENNEDVFPSTQGSIPRARDDATYIPDTFHLIGPGFNEEGPGRPIPSVRVVPTRRAYVRRLKPPGSQNLPYDGNDDEFNFRRNNQNFPANINIPPGAEFSPVRPGLFPDENFGPLRNVPNRPLISQDGPPGSFGTLRNVQYFSPNRPNTPSDFERDVFSPGRLQPNFVPNRPNRIQDVSPGTGRNPSNGSPFRSNRPPQADGFDALRTLPNYTPTRQNIPAVPVREEPILNSNPYGDETRNQVNRPQPAATTTPRRVIRLRRPGNAPQIRPQSGRELLDRKPIINALPDEKEAGVRARGPVVLTGTAIVRDSKVTDDLTENKEKKEVNPFEYTEPLPLTYYTTFTYMTTFLNGPSTAYSTREAVVSNIATETVNPRLIGLIRSRGGFSTPNGVQTAVPLGSRAQGATTTIVNLASRVQLYNSDVYYGRHSKPLEGSPKEDIVPTEVNLRTVPITDVASLPKTYYTLFTYFYTLNDGDKSTHSQRSETKSHVDTETEPFILQDFSSTVDNSGLLTLKPNKQIVNLGLRTARGTTTEVNLELKTVVHINGLKNAIIDRGSITPTLVEVTPSETDTVLNNYLDPDDAEVQDQQTYPQTVPIQPSFSSANEVYAGTQRSSSNKEATPEIPANSRIIRTQSLRGPLRVASTVLQRPGTLRSGVFAPRPGVRVRVRPVSSRVVAAETESVTSLAPDASSYSINFDPSRTISDDANDFDDDLEEVDVTEHDEEDDSNDEFTTEENKTTEEEENKRERLPGRKRLKITIRRSPGVSTSRTTSAAIRPTRTRPRFYVVTRTASPTGGPVRTPKRPVSVKVSRRLRPTGEPEYETYTTVTSVPVVFGLSTTYRNAIVTSSSLVTPEASPDPSKTVILTYFTTTTYTVPYTIDGVATYTTLEETNSRIATETLDPDADLSFVSTTTVDYRDEILESSADLVKQPPQTLKPQLVNNQLNVGPRVNLATKISNGVTLIVATDGEGEATHLATQPTLTLRPTIVTDALLMVNKDITTVYEPRTFYTTFTFFTTFFSGGTPSISTSEQVITNVYSVPVTQSITRTQPAYEPFTVVETSENLVSRTVYTTHTIYATLFNGTGTIVTPIEELHSSVISSTETYTITKTVMPTPEIIPSEIKPTETLQPVSTTVTSIYRTITNFITLFRGSESEVSPLEEIQTDVITLTLDNRPEPSIRERETYTTRTVQATNTHYITLFSGSESILSSITEVAPSVVTELVKQLQEPTTTPFVDTVRIQPTAVISSSSSSIEPIFQDLVPSIRTEYTTLTYFTTLFTDSSTILSSREEIATSYITFFVPAPVPGATTDNINTFTSQTDVLTHTSSSKTDEIKQPSVTPTSEILTFYTTYTYYTTLFRGTETIISDSETIVTQYVTIESTPTDSVSRHSTSLPPTFSRPNYDSFEIRTEPSNTPVVTSPSFNKESGSDTSESKTEEDLKIIGVSTKVESDSETPSILTGIPSTDANGATHILFTDFIAPSSAEDSPVLSTDLVSEYVTPSLPDLVSSVKIFTKPTSVSFKDTTFSSQESSTPSSARDSASDLATTRLTDNNVATHMVLRPTTSHHSSSSHTLGIKPGAVIDLSDVLTNTNLVGNLGETIKDIVNLFAANGNRAKNSTSKSSQSSSDTSIVLPSGGITISSAEDPVFIPIGAIARGTKTSSSPSESNTGVPILQPSTMLSGFTPIITDDDKFTLDVNNRKIDSVSPKDMPSDTLTSIVFGSNTIFIQPTNIISDVPATVLFSDMDGRFHSSYDMKILQGSESNRENSQQQGTPSIKFSETTSLVTGLETIFFGFPDARQPPQATTQLIQGSGSTSSIVGYETIFFDSPQDFYIPGSNKVNISGATTIFGTFPAITESSTSSTPESTFTSSSSGETTIFFPVPGDHQQQNPGTRYVTSVESVTLTLTLTTSSVYQTEDTPVTVTSVFTTTIPPRTFVSTIIGDRTILGTQPEPTEAVQVIPTIQPSESTTTVTTTTLIFNSIATTVVRTLVIPTNAIQPTKPSTSEATDTVKLGGFNIPPTTTERTRKPIQLFKSGNRPTEPTTPKPQRTGPPLKLFPTKPPTTTTKTPPTRPVTTRKNTFRKPGKTLVPITDGCPRECNLKNKEVCKQNPDKTWSCQCRPGFFKKNGTEECRDVKSFVVLVRVLKMGDNDVTYSPDLSNHLSPEYKNLTTTARKAVDNAYKTSSVGDDFVSTNVLSVARDSGGLRREGVLVNLTVQLSGEKPANEEFLKEELAQSLEAASSEISLANASVSPIIQRVEDVQDFDECYDDSYNDCSRSAICLNLPGTYTCQCKDGYQDLEPQLPGRFCSGEIKDCDYCNNRGVCIMTEDENKFCRCYRMYLGKQCEINGLVLAIALPIALALLILTMFCLLCGCRKLRQRRAQKPKPNVFKGMVPPLAGTLDRKAMIMDSSSESSGEHRPPPAHAYDGFGEEVANSTMKRSRRSDSLDDHISEFQVPTVLIPRAKHSHPKQVNAPYPNYRMPHGDMDRW